MTGFKKKKKIMGDCRSLSIVCVFVVCYVVPSSWCLSTGCYKPVDGPRPSHILSDLPSNYIETSTLPKEFDWRKQFYLTPPTNQFLPSPCGSCWAHASSGALTDRFMIANKGFGDDTSIGSCHRGTSIGSCHRGSDLYEGSVVIPPLSPQALIDCGDDTNIGSCDGGDDSHAYKFIHENGITDVTCLPYMGVSQTNWGERGNCSQRMCRHCDRYGNCQFIDGIVYHITEYGSVKGEQNMMAEIYARGPIACSLYAHSKYFEKYTGGIIADPTPYNFTTHVVAIVGWGVEGDTSYWIGRNSFGTVWGEQGWFKLLRGNNTLHMENSKYGCSWAVPKLS